MFEIYPGLENLELRVEVDWQGRKRQVTVRVETWPGASYAVLSCEFEDEGSKYFIKSGKAFYQTGTSDRWFCNYAVHDANSGQPRNARKFSDRGEAKFRALVRYAFAENDAKWGVVRLIQLPELPGKPRVVVEFPENLCWCSTPLWPDFTPFRLPSALSLDEHAAKQQILDAWQDESSDAHFAWQWAMLTQEERYLQLTGFEGNQQELEVVMRSILQGTSKLWRVEKALEWILSPEEPWSNIDSATDNEEIAYEVVKAWYPILQSYFAPAWQEKRLTNHLCAQKFWEQRGFLPVVSVDSSPTAHEQLEAKLQLRNWLADKATPDEAARLLASLDD